MSGNSARPAGTTDAFLRLGDVGGDGPAHDAGGRDAQPFGQGDNPDELDGGERHREPGRQVVAESISRRCPLGEPAAADAMEGHGHPTEKPDRDDPGRRSNAWGA